MNNILIIEDNKPYREMLNFILTEENFNVRAAENGIIGLKMANTETPDLIITNIEMPELDGFEVVMELRKNKKTSTIPVIFLTGHPSEEFKQRSEELGARVYFDKTIILDELIDKIKSIIF
jgi:DNA-binding response OmpR family regulator